MNRKLIYGLFICMFAFLATNASAQYWGDVEDYEYTGTYEFQSSNAATQKISDNKLLKLSSSKFE